MLAENMHFLIGYLELKLHTQSETITDLLKNDKFVSNLLFMKHNLANSIILPPKKWRIEGVVA